jgi:hypothetical protein
MPIRIDLGVSVGPRAKRVPTSGAKRIPANSGAKRIPSSGAKRVPVNPGGKRAAQEHWREAKWTAVLDISEAWRIGEDWWRERPIRRTYFRLIVQDGRTVTVFRDELAAAFSGSEMDGGWFEQRY